MPLLAIPTTADVNRITKAFLTDLESFTYRDELSKELKPIICSVCDSMPTKAQWSTFVDIAEFRKLCAKGKLRKTDSPETYPMELRNQYTAKDVRLQQFILSPETLVNAQHEVLVCKECLFELRSISKQRHNTRCRPPAESIIRGYMIGDAPDLLSDLNPVELSLITKTVTQCQSWIFFAGSHQAIKGWHTFFKGRPGDNIGNLMLMTKSGWKGHILVVLCGPFTSEQAMLTRTKCRVCPYKVIAAWEWLIANNYRYHGLKIPHIDSLPLPYILDDER
jgi:hypothetical protein